MRANRWGVLAAIVIGFGFSSVQAAEVTVKGVHLCCGQCVTGVKKALADVSGVSDVAGNQGEKTVTFKAADGNAAEAGIKALAKAGFHGTATADGKDIKFPESGAEKGKKADSITVTDLHLCCGACVTGVKKALDGLPGVTGNEVDQKGKSVTVTGKDIDVVAFVDALNKAGYHCNVKK